MVAPSIGISSLVSLLKVVTMLVSFVMVLLPATVAKGAVFFIVAQTNPKLVEWSIVQAPTKVRFHGCVNGQEAKSRNLEIKVVLSSQRLESDRL